MALLVPLTSVTTAGPITVGSTHRIDRVARWYLQRIGHDLGAIFLYRDLGLATCDRFSLALQYSRESATQAVAGGFPQQPELNGTNANISEILAKLAANGCAVPAPQAMFVATGAAATVTHTYAAPGTYVARVTVGDGAASCRRHGHDHRRDDATAAAERRQRHRRPTRRLRRDHARRHGVDA